MSVKAVKLISDPLGVSGLINQVPASGDFFYLSEVGKEGIWVYDDIDVSSGANTGTVLITTGGQRLKRYIAGDFVKAEWFGAVAVEKDPTTNEYPVSPDSTSAVQAAIDYASSKGLKVKFGKGKFIIAGKITVKANVTIEGSNWNIDDVENGTTLLMTTLNSMIEMEKQSVFTDISILYPSQDYKLYTELEVEVFHFKSYPTTFTIDTLTRIERVNYIGGWNMIVTRTDLSPIKAYTVEKTTIKSIYGYALNNVIDIIFSTDVPIISDLHFNPNSLRAIGMPDVNETDTHGVKHTGLTVVGKAVARTGTFIKLARVDDVHMTNIFAYGYSVFIHTYRSAYLEETETPANLAKFAVADFQLSNWGADINTTTFLLERNNSAFGTSITNGFTTPLISPSPRLSNEIDMNQCVVKIVGVSNLIVKICNLNVIGYIGFDDKYLDKKPVKYYFINQGGTGNHILCTNFYFNSYEYSEISSGFVGSNSVQIVSAIQPDTSTSHISTPIGLSAPSLKTTTNIIRPSKYQHFALLNSWTNVNNATPFTYWKDSDGNTHIIGNITGGNQSQIIYVLPPEYRSTSNQFNDFVVYTADVMGVVRVWGDGVIVLIRGTGTNVALGHIVLYRNE